MASERWNMIRKRIGIAFLVIIAIMLGLLLQIVIQLPDVSSISEYSPFESTTIFSADGKVIATLHKEEDRLVVPLSRISLNLQKAILIAEDVDFFQHHGINFKGILRAVFVNLTRGGLSEGGSTITQQLARNLFLSPEKTFTRKISEALLALQIERQYTKEDILELYLNQVYWGHNVYGIETASQIYFGKNAADLNLPESALLAGIVRSPEVYSPYKNEEGAKNIRDYVLKRMAEYGVISEQEYEEAAASPIILSTKKLNRFKYAAPYFTSYVIEQLKQKFGEQIVYQGGLRVYTTLDTKMQQAAEASVRKFLKSEGGRYNFSQAALAAIDPRTGYIKAMVGGANYDTTQYNRATQSLRQPGSSFKPFVYTAALEAGISPGTILEDTPVTYQTPKGPWSPKNFDLRFRGAVSMRRALELSLNIPAIKLLEKVGTSAAIAVARRMGITTPLQENLSLTLGTSEIKLIEMVSAFGVFANGGVRVEPTAITKIAARDGTIIEKHTVTERRALDPNINYLMVDMMQGVILRGTGVMGYFGRPAAAKTGTTEEFRDAWFIGFVPQLAAGVWVGNDDNRSMRGVAEVAVCPRMWKEFMRPALAGQPILSFPRPQGLVGVSVCLESGLRATQYCPKTTVLTFPADKAPTAYCAIHTSAPKPKEEEMPEWLKEVSEPSGGKEETEEGTPEWLR